MLNFVTAGVLVAGAAKPGEIGPMAFLNYEGTSGDQSWDDPATMTSHPRPGPVAAS